MMKLFVVLIIFNFSLLVHAHIHSHKVAIERDDLTLSTWISALISSALVGACGIFPLLINKWVKLDESCKQKLAFKGILSFSVGGLLGDVFLHLLPEAYGVTTDFHKLGIGLWVLVGFLAFLIVEKLMKSTESASESAGGDSESVGGDGTITKTNVKDILLNYAEIQNNSNTNCSTLFSDSGNVLTRRTLANGNSIKKYIIENHSQIQNISSNSSPQSKWLDKDISGYLNLVANSTDNFTHGLAIAASYVASPIVGVLTTLAILCHEIPHEVGDFAILLNSGFSLKEAAKAQMLTACGGLVGVTAGLTAEQLSNASSWLLPFTAGGFLYIALVSIIPGLLECKNFKHSVIEILAIVLGVVVMALVTIVEKKSCQYMPPLT